MQKDKSEKLKEILNETLSTEDIEKKLKEEQKNFSNIKEKLKEEDNLIPKIEITKKTDSNILVYSMGIIALLLFILTIYLFTNDIGTVSKNEKIKNDSNLIFEEKDTIDYLAKKEISKVIKIDSEKKDKNENDIKTKEIIKEKIVFKTVDISKDNFKKIYNSLKFNTLKCYNFKAGNTFPNLECENKLKEFLDNNKNTLRFEIIPVIAKDDYILFHKLEANIKSLDKEFQTKIKEYMLRGLSRERVLEISWRIKEFLGEDVILTPTNYYVKSKKNNKGIIIKAYH